MESYETIEVQVALPKDLYCAIQQQAELHGCSVNCEIIALLTVSLDTRTDRLAEEWEAWEAASDEDWLKMEAMLAAEKP